MHANAQLSGAAPRQRSSGARKGEGIGHHIEQHKGARQPNARRSKGTALVSKFAHRTVPRAPSVHLWIGGASSL